MSDRIKITWHGHACYKLECGGHSIVIDPYREVPGYPALDLTAGAVCASHTQHDDHGYFEAVTVKEEAGESPFTITTVDCFHDPEGGTLRGVNKITIFEAAGKRLAHFGDLGHILSEEQLAAVGKCDVAFMPVGGFYTVDAAEAKQIIDALDPVTVIPMHYRTGEFGFDVIAEPEDFLDLCTDRTVIRHNGAVLEVDDSQERRAVLLKFEA